MQKNDSAANEESLFFNKTSKLSVPKVHTVRISTPWGYQIVYTIKESSFVIEKDDEEEKRLTELKKETETFISEYSSLKEEERYSDAYYFRLSEYHALSKDWQKEAECLSHIKDKSRPFYAERISVNALRKNENSEENCNRLYEINSTSSIRKLTAFYMADGKYELAWNAFVHWSDGHMEEEPPYELLCQAGLLAIKLGKLNVALQLFRKAFYNQNTAPAALTIATLYNAMVSLSQYCRTSRRQKRSIVKKTKKWLGIALILDPCYTGAVKLACSIYFKGRVLGDGGKSLSLLEKKLALWCGLPSSRKNGWYFKALLNWGLCNFLDGRFNRTLEILRSVLQQNELLEAAPPLITETESVCRYASVWHNIALCQFLGAKETSGRERAIKSINRAIEKCLDLCDKEKEAAGSNATLLSNRSFYRTLHDSVLTACNFYKALGREKEAERTLRLLEQHGIIINLIE